MKQLMPKVYGQLEKVRVTLEKHYRDMQDMEFTVEDGKLYMLQTRTASALRPQRSRWPSIWPTRSSSRRKKPSMRIKPEDIERLFYPVIDAEARQEDA